MSESDWKWYGHPGHLIVADKCRFHLCTIVGEFMISTVGEYWPERSVREVHAHVYDPEWLARNTELLGDEFDNAYFERFGYERIGASFMESIDDDPIYETMVFRTGEPCADPACDCGMPRIADAGNCLDSRRYATAGKATAGHYELCRKWDLVRTEALKEQA